MTAANAARFRWRADLLDYHAAHLPNFDTTKDDKQSDAARLREEADLMDAYNAAVAAKSRPAVRALGRQLREVRHAGRLIREARGQSGPAVLDNFSEPSDYDLLGG